MLLFVGYNKLNEYLLNYGAMRTWCMAEPWRFSAFWSADQTCHFLKSFEFTIFIE